MILKKNNYVSSLDRLFSRHRTVCFLSQLWYLNEFKLGGKSKELQVYRGQSQLIDKLLKPRNRHHTIYAAINL